MADTFMTPDGTRNGEGKTLPLPSTASPPVPAPLQQSKPLRLVCVLLLGFVAFTLVSLSWETNAGDAGSDWLFGRSAFHRQPRFATSSPQPIYPLRVERVSSPTSVSISPSTSLLGLSLGEPASIATPTTVPPTSTKSLSTLVDPFSVSRPAPDSSSPALSTTLPFYAIYYANLAANQSNSKSKKHKKSPPKPGKSPKSKSGAEMKPLSIQSCQIGASGSKLNGQPLLAARFRALADPAFHVQVAFHLITPDGRPFIGVTTDVTSSTGETEAALPALESDDGLASAFGLRLGGRARVKGRGSESNPAAWLEEAELVECEIVAGDFAAALEKPGLQASATPPSPASHFVEMYRYTLKGYYPDFLTNHNAADSIGTAWHLHLVGRGRKVWTRYCVEILNASLDNISVHSGEGFLNGQPYADYQSCSGGACTCLGPVDRVVARMPLKSKLSSQCSGAQCRCSKQSELQSASHVGRLPLKLPFFRSMPPFQIQDYLKPETEQEGSWYSLPGRGMCLPNETIGDRGCTWRRQASYAISYPDRIQNFSHEHRRWSGGTVIRTETMLHNSQMLKESYGRLPLRLPSCR